MAEYGEAGRYPQIVETIEPPRRITYRWANRFAPAEPVDGNAVRVELTVLAEAVGAPVTRSEIELRFGEIALLVRGDCDVDQVVRVVEALSRRTLAC